MKSFAFVLFSVLFKRFDVSVASQNKSSPMCSTTALGEAKEIIVGFNCSYTNMTMARLEANGTHWCQVVYSNSQPATCAGGASCSCEPYRPNSMTYITMSRNLSADLSGSCIVFMLELRDESQSALHKKTFVVKGSEKVTYDEEEGQCRISIKTNGLNKKEESPTPSSFLQTVLLVFAVVTFVVTTTICCLQRRLRDFLCPNRRQTRCCAGGPLPRVVGIDSSKSLASSGDEGSEDSMILIVGGFSRCSSASVSDVATTSRPPTAVTAVEYSEVRDHVLSDPILDVTDAPIPRDLSATQTFLFTDCSNDYSEACNTDGPMERPSTLSVFASDLSLRPPMPPPV